MESYKDSRSQGPLWECIPRGSRLVQFTNLVSSSTNQVLSFHFSTIPLLHHSNTPSFHNSTTPRFETMIATRFYAKDDDK